MAMEHLMMLMMRNFALNLRSRRPDTDKDFLLHEHATFLREDEHFQQNALPVPVQRTTVPIKVQLCPENQISISTMIHSDHDISYGEFLLCRTIAPPIKMAALATVVDDPEGELAVRLALYNYAPTARHLTRAQCNRILPVGTILAIKNPWFKKAADGGLILRCDNPADVVVMDEQTVQALSPGLVWAGAIPAEYAEYMKKKKPKASSSEPKEKSWKSIGNELLALEEFLKAAEAYTTGLNEKPGDVSLLGNRASAYLSMKKFDLALADAEDILKTNPSNKKGIARKARALWGLKQYKTAKGFLTKKIRMRELKNDKEIQELRDKAEIFLGQAKYGKYPKEIHCALNHGKEETLDWVDYEGDIIVKDTADGRGRGLYATKDMAAGQLILASKAFVFVQGLTKSDSFPSNSEAGARVMNYLNHGVGELISMVTGSLKNNPSRGNVLYKLYAGPEMKYLDSEKGDDCSVIDMKRIDAICKYNAFGEYCPITRREKSSGIWILPSFINHSCINCNASWKLYGDFLFVRAFKDIKTGEEVTVSYMTPADSYTERQVYFQKYGFQCKCQLCEYDRQESQAVAAEQVDILKKISVQPTEWRNGRVFFCNGSMTKVIPLVEQFMKIRPKYQLQLIEVIVQFPFYQNNAFSKAVKYLKIQYEILKDTPIRDGVVDATTGIILSSLQLGKTKDAQHWALKLKNAAISAHGNLDIVHNNQVLIESWKMCGVNI